MNNVIVVDFVNRVIAIALTLICKACGTEYTRTFSSISARNAVVHAFNANNGICKTCRHTPVCDTCGDVATVFIGDKQACDVCDARRNDDLMAEPCDGACMRCSDCLLGDYTL